MEDLDVIIVDDKVLRITANLYWKQSATVRIDCDHSEKNLIQRGIRERCIVSPLIFDIHSEKLFDDALSDTMWNCNK